MAVVKRTQKRGDALAAAGVSIPTVQFTREQLRKMKLQAEVMMDDFLKKAGVEDPAQSVDAQGFRHFRVGSAQGMAAIREMEDTLVLHVAAHLMPLPSDRDLILPLMRELLAFNAGLPGEARFCLMDEEVVASALLPLVDLSPQDFARCFYSVMQAADTLDDQLRKKYGGSSRQPA